MEMNKEIRCFVEFQQEPLNDENRKLLKEIETGKKEFFKRDGNVFCFTVCGFMVVNDRPIIIFPKNYQLPKNESHFFDTKDIKEDGELLLRTFRHYRSHRKSTKGWKERNTETGIDEHNDNAISGIEDILYILEDFQRNGYLVRRHAIVSQTRPGRIMWNKTIHQTTPIINHGRVFYASPYMKSNVRHDDEMVQKIHRYLVDKFRSDWGWILGMKAGDVEPIEPCSSEDAIKILSTELSSCYVQREIDLFRHMLRYYREKWGTNKKKRFDYMLTSEMEQIWETICGHVLGNVKNDYQDKLPSAIFTSSNEIAFDIEQEWKQKLDILYKKDNKFYILDAKYYPINLEDGSETQYNFPKIEDIRKQFVYYYTMQKTFERCDDGYNVVSNILLFPGKHEEEFKYLGYATMYGIPEFDNVHFWSMNVRKMLEAYVNEHQGCRTEAFFKRVD